MYPEYVEIDGKLYKINTNFRVAIECNKIAEDATIGDLERSLAIIFVLFGEDGINTPPHYEKLLEMAKKYLLCGKEPDLKKNTKPDMDLIQDMDYIEASFMSDYGIDLQNTEMHWWKFYKLLNGLSDSEIGNCCILNRIRNLRNTDLSTIKDKKQRDKIKEAQKNFALKDTNEKYTQMQKERASNLYKQLGIERK